MRATSLLFACLAGLLPCAPTLAGESLARHELRIRIDPERNHLHAVDELRFANRQDGGAIEFALSDALEITSASLAIEELPRDELLPAVGIDGGEADAGRQTYVRRYRAVLPAGDAPLRLTYSGQIAFGLSDQKEEYTRGFRETRGEIGPEGIYLSGASAWYPRVGDEMLTFRLEIEQPDGWHVISQGEGTSRNPQGLAIWVSDDPMEEIHLVGGALNRYRDAAGAVEALVYLHAAEEPLAQKYLDATSRYIEMYRRLIGPYPYRKFALVENFWETGYGMPSFTLLGESVIRFPFILTSSYPHEILHNWWGNSVFVDAESGNWCEGLTAYMADHLIQEQRGRGAEYRRGSLQKYRDYVRDGRDFPLREFRSRHSAATEAVGYGKALMTFHMLRGMVGDDAFREAFARFYRAQKGKRASFDDIRESFEKVSGRDLSGWFSQWIDRPGAVALELEEAQVKAVADGFQLELVIRQTQAGEAYQLELPVSIRTREGWQQERVPISERVTRLALSAGSEPVEVRIDPEFDLFRLLDPRETPPSIGQIFGDEKILAVLPGDARAEQIGRYRQLMSAWQSESHAIELVLDRDLEQLPDDRSCWVLGRKNRYIDTLFAGQVEGLRVTQERIFLAGRPVEIGAHSIVGHSVVALRRHPRAAEKAIGLLLIDPPAAFPGMARKLPHYGKYSYLAFEGDEPSNIVKGQWAASGSPLRRDLRPADRRGEPLPSDAPEPAAALCEPPPVFSSKALREHVTYLAAPEREGRGLGSDGLQAAGDYIIRQFEAAGLAPGGPDGSWRQPFTVAEGADGRPVQAANIIGVLRGTEPAFREQSVLISAHYDHLGRGWPDVHQGDAGQIHPGGDDNASGVAVLIELARNLASGGRPRRTILFVAFSAEEAGRLGSRHFVEHPTPLALDGLLGVINLDTVGRLGKGPLTLLGTGTSYEWPHVFRGVGFVTGIECNNVAGNAEGSDQMSFIDRGIPGVQVFTGAHGDYHRPGDTAEKVDIAGLVQVATFCRESLAWLANEREEPLTVTIENRAAPPQAVAARPGKATRAPAKRRVRLGTVPAYSFPGPGVLLDDVGEGTPAALAGLQEGDVLMAIDGHELADLKTYSELLKGIEPGQKISVRVRRDQTEWTVEMIAEAR